VSGADGEEAGPGAFADASGPGTVVVPEALDGVRADRAVALLADLARSAVERAVDAGLVLVNGEPVRARSQRLRAGDRLTLPAGPEPPAELAPDPGVAVPVVHADADVVVVDKPAGLVVHPGAGHVQGTLIQGLLARFPELADLAAEAGTDPTRPGIVHRLDRGTSGLLVVARTPAAYRSLVAQLAERTVSRRYLALVHGHVEAPTGVVDAPIGRSARTPTRMTVSDRGRPARTRYRVIERLGTGSTAVTLLEAELETGRTHQVRVHFAAIGHPVVGDEAYRGSGRRGVSSLLRQFLHAGRLAFTHPASGRLATFEAPLPPELVDELRRQGAADPSGGLAVVVDPGGAPRPGDRSIA
jgi:23S rRNA pseudouridine1911/1915/1917 synthase